MSQRRTRMRGRPGLHLVTFRHEATYRLPDGPLDIPAGTQLIGALTEVPEPVLHLGTMSLALSHEIADIQPSPEPALTLRELARRTAQRATDAAVAGDLAAAADSFLQAAVQHRLLDDIDAEIELREAAQRVRNRAARTPEALAQFDRHTADMSDEGLRQLGATVRLAVRQLGGLFYAPASPEEAEVLWDVIRHAVVEVANRDHWYRQHPRPAEPISSETMWVDGEALVGALLAELDGSPDQLATTAEVALALDPDDADAHRILGRLAAEAGDLQEARRRYEAGVRAGERKLGAAFFSDSDRPRFWLALETRPYMRVRAALADVLTKLGEPERAIAEYWGMLELNPGDNQGIRYILASLLLERQDLAGVERLYREVATVQLEEQEVGDEDEEAPANVPSARTIDALDPEQLNVYEGAMWLFPAALYHFQREGDGERARAVLELARTQNPHVVPLLTGRARLPREGPESYSHGSREEALIYAREGRRAWEATPGALAWLRERAASRAPSKRTAARAAAPLAASAPNTSLRELLVAWVDDARTEQSAATKKVYRATIARLLDQLAAQGAPGTGAALTDEAVAAFLASVEPGRRSQARNSIRVWCEWLRRQGALERNPVAG